MLLNAIRPRSRIEWVAMAAFFAAIMSPLFLHLFLPPDWAGPMSLAVIGPAVLFFAGAMIGRPRD